MGKKIIISQSNYIPWKGYFDAIAACDYFVIYDDVQYTRRDWRNRNVIKGPASEKWLTIPVEVKGKYEQRINETVIADNNWTEQHLKTLNSFYVKAPHYTEVNEWVNNLYQNCNFQLLTEVNQYFLEAIFEFLGIKTKIFRSENFITNAERSLRLAEICQQLNADEYHTGPAAKNYLDETVFAAKGIKINYIDNSGYKEYLQLGNGFNHNVTILDLIYNTGTNAPEYLKNIK